MVNFEQVIAGWESDCLSYFNLNFKSSIEHVSFPTDKIKRKRDKNRQQPTNCLSVFNHFVGLALIGYNLINHQGLTNYIPEYQKNHLMNYLYPSLYFFSKSFNEGELLQDWKDAIFTPLHKKEEKEFASNY